MKEPVETSVIRSNWPRVALITLNAQYAHTSLALRQLRQWAINLGFPQEQITIHEWTINDLPSLLLQRLYTLDADLYAFSCSIWNRNLTARLSDELAKVRPDATLLWGGPEASQDAAAILRGHPAVQGILAGEGERSFAAYIKDFAASGLDPQKIPGLIFRDHAGQIVMNPQAPLLSPADWLFPYSEAELAVIKDRLVYFETSRGCPYGCTYCLSSLDKTVRLASLDWVQTAFGRLISADLKQVKLVDRTFNIQPERARMIWKWLIDRHHEKPFRTNFHFEIMADKLEDEDLSLLATAPPGLIQFEIGVQTTTPRVLKAIHRPCNWQRLQHNVRFLRDKAAIHLHLDLIAGLPSETFSEFARSFNDVFFLNPHDLQLGFLKILPGSPMASQAQSLRFRWSSEPPYEILASDAQSYGELVQLKEIETVLNAFHNSGKFIFTLSWLLDHFKSPFEFFQTLAISFRKAGWFEQKTNPATKVRFLLEFAQRHVNANEQEVLLSRLKLDYLHQGAKDQPDFLDTLENSQLQDRRVHLKSTRDQVRLTFPRLNRCRVEDFTFDDRIVWPGQMTGSRGLDSASPFTDCLPKGKCVCAFDLSTPEPVLVFVQKLP